MLAEFNPNPIAMLVKNELTAKNMGAGSGLQPFPGNNSGPREQMFASHQGQCMVIRGAEERFLQSGVEPEYGTCTFKIAMPFTGTVFQVIPKLSPVAGGYQFRYNPLKVAIVESEENPGVVGTVRVERFHTSHQTFGFMFDEVKRNMSNLRAGYGFMRDDKFMQSPAITPSGGYGYGTNLNVMFGSFNAVDNDGVVLGDQAIPKLTSTGVITAEGSWGRKKYPLNLYGTKDRYQPFPNIGDKIRDDGLLFALRSFEGGSAVTEMTPEALMEVDHIWDTCVYGKPGGEVVDITIHHGTSKVEPTPVGMEEQTRMYLNHQNTFYERIRRAYFDLKKKYGEHLKLTPEFHNLIVRAFAEDPDQPGFIIKTLNKNPLDDWHISLTYTFDVVPAVGSKITDCHGGLNSECSSRLYGAPSQSITALAEYGNEIYSNREFVVRDSYHEHQHETPRQTRGSVTLPILAQNNNSVENFSSLTQAAKHFNVDRSSITNRLNNGKDLNGWTFTQKPL